MIPDKHKLAFRNALYSGQYNLLFGSGISLDSTNSQGSVLLDAEKFRSGLCELTDAPSHTSLPRVYALLSGEQIDKYVTAPYSGCVAGPSLSFLTKYLWRRMFTFNIDDVVENCFEGNENKKQRLAPVNFIDSFEPTPDRDQVQIIHLHGFTRQSEHGYVFSLAEYARVMRGLNPWMHLLSEILATEPFIIAGTSLNESDLEYYLSHRTAVTPRRGLAPSFLIDPNHSVVSRADCDRHGLVPIDGTFGDFLEWVAKEHPSPPTLTQLVIPDISSVFDEEVNKKSLLKFFASFELVAAADQEQERTPTAFLYGREPTWSEIQRHVDIDRSETTPIVGLAQNIAEGKLREPARLIVILDEPGTGKSTTLKRSGHELARMGQPVLALKTFDRLNDEAAVDCLRHAIRPVVFLVDGFADHVDQVLTILEDEQAAKNAVIIAADRSYRGVHIENILGSVPRMSSKLAPFSEDELAQVLERYRLFGLVGDHYALKNPRSFLKKLEGDPIAVCVCRILNDFSPLDQIVESLWKASSQDARLPYLSVALAQHCYRSGLRFSVLQRIIGPTASVNDLLGSSMPLQLIQNPTDDDFVVAMNSSIAERVLIHSSHSERELVFDAFVALANAIGPRVNRRAIMRRTPEARLAGRLFDFDSVVKPFLHQMAERFYLKVQPIWEWNSRYWEQRALLASESDIRIALQHARHAVAIELHPFPLTTLGKLLFQHMEEIGNREANFNEGFDRLCAAIDIEVRRERSTVHPFRTLLVGALRYVELGGELTPDQKHRLGVHRDQAKYRFENDEAIQASVRRLEDMANT